MDDPYRAHAAHLQPPPPPSPRLTREEAQRAAFAATRCNPKGTYYFDLPGVELGRRGRWSLQVEVLNDHGIHWSCIPVVIFQPDPPVLPKLRAAATLFLWLGFLGVFA